MKRAAGRKLSDRLCTVDDRHHAILSNLVAGKRGNGLAGGDWRLLLRGKKLKIKQSAHPRARDDPTWSLREAWGRSGGFFSEPEAARATGRRRHMRGRRCVREGASFRGSALFRLPSVAKRAEQTLSQLLPSNARGGHDVSGVSRLDRGGKGARVYNPPPFDTLSPAALRRCSLRLVSVVRRQHVKSAPDQERVWCFFPTKLRANRHPHTCRSSVPPSRILNGRSAHNIKPICGRMRLLFTTDSVYLVCTIPTLTAVAFYLSTDRSRTCSSHPWCLVW